MKISRSIRAAAARPVLSTVIVLTLALGVGVNAAIFSLTREVLLRPLPYKDADRLVRVFETSQTLGRSNAGIRPVNYVAWRDGIEAFEETAIFRRVSFNVSIRTTPLKLEGFLVGSTFFPMLGVEPAIGRGFRDEDARPGGDGVVLLSHDFWRRQFGGDPAVVGQSVEVDGTPCTIVGVLPSSFKIYRVLNRELDVFRPLVLDATDGEQSLNVYAKLKRDVSLDAARGALRTAYASLPVPNPLWSADAALLSTSFAAQSRSVLLTLQWAVALVLLIACANVANLLLAVSVGRRREHAIRQALGASRWRIAWDLSGETLILTVAGSALAMLFATWIIAVLNATVSFQDINRLRPFSVDGWVLAFAGGLTAAMTLAFSLIPACAGRDRDVIDALKDSTHGVTPGISNRRLRQALVIGEMALSIVLAVSAVALTRSALVLYGFERGLSVDHVMTAEVSLQGPSYDDSERLVRVAAAIVERVSAASGVAAAALVNYPPVSLIRVGVPVSIEGHPPPSADQRWYARHWVVSPDYFRTAGIPIRAGRDFTANDDALRPGVAIISESFARRFWNSIDVVGRRLKTEFPESRLFWVPRARRGWLTIVGVVGDVREDGLSDAANLPQLYLPYAQNPTTTLTVMARARGWPPESVAPAIREAVRSTDPKIPVSHELKFEEVIQGAFARPREMAWLVGAFAALALVLAAFGVYGVVAYLTTARMREIGIRVAVGATSTDIIRLIVSHAMTLTAAGVAFGLVLAPLALRLMSGLLFGVGPYNATTLVSVAALLTAVSAGAAAIPAIRAARFWAASRSRIAGFRAL